ncbi:MAG: hypothetical protein AB1644_05885 [Candidatus Zixiibacteriota bacterium]
MPLSLRNILCSALYLALALASASSGSAQDPADTVGSLPGIEIQTSVDLAEAFVGDLITYRLSIIHDSDIRLVPPPLGANLGAFDVKDYEPDVETKLPDGRIKSETKFVLSTFTTGDYIIPPLPMMFELRDSTRKVMLSEAVPIKVKSLLENAGDSMDIRPLKPQYEFKRNLTPYYIAGAASLLLLVIAILVLRRLRKGKGVAEVIDLRAPWEIAFEKLAFLRESRLLDDGKHKQFYIELTEIIRAYLGRVYRVAVLDMTTEEFLSGCRDMQQPTGLLEKTETLLHHADLVKFAKLQPEREQADEDFLLGHDIVEIVRADQERQNQVQVHNSASTPQGAAASGGAS